jgi:hypothetical protein
VRCLAELLHGGGGTNSTLLLCLER